MLECRNYTGIKLLAHTMKLSERIIDQSIRQLVELDGIQFGLRKAGRQTIQYLSCAYCRKSTETKENSYIKLWYLLIWKRRTTEYQGT